MARSDVNVVVLSGRVGHINELKAFGDRNLLAFSLACSRSVKREDQWQEETDWFNISVWGPRAVGLNNVLAKGKPVTVSGRITTQKKEVDGKSVTYFGILADEVVLQGTAGDGKGKQQSDAGAYVPPAASGDADEFPY